MTRRGGASEDAPDARRERSNSSSSSAAGSSSAVPAASPQFATLHSRVGKRYQAAIPELLQAPADAAELLFKTQALQQPRPRYCPDRAEELGLELDKYLKLAHSLRDGATFDTQEQVETLALQLLHRFDYNPTDAACSLYARHSIELPRSAVAPQSTKSTAAEEAKKWLLAFYRCMRRTTIDEKVLEHMCQLHDKAENRANAIPATEAGVLARLVKRILKWREQCEEVGKEKADRARLLLLLHQAEDMQVVLPEKEAVVSRLREFDSALTLLKEALDHSSKRHQSRKVELGELNALFEAVMAPRLVFPEEERFRATVDEAKDLKATIDKMLAEDKVSLPVMRDVLAKIELVPVNFEQEVEQFQNKMLSAQKWLAKARKCMPNRRATRRAGGADTKKMDLEAIRALVDDAPCENSTEMFEMQDLLACADVWAVKVKEAIDGGSDVSLEHLKELLEEAKDIPVVMDEQKFLEAEIAAREWCTTAAAKLASRKSIEEMEVLITQAKTIREQIHPKKQSRWKPQVERDIHAAMDQSRKWINELRDNLGVAAFDKLFASLPSYVASSHRSSTSTANVDRAKKKSTDAISKLIEKSQSLAIDVSSYTTPLNELLLKGVEAQAEASAILMSIGCLSGTDSGTAASTSMDIDSMPRELGDLAQASLLLERIDAFPFTFEEGLTLADIVEGEKTWAARVRDCIPPRQSRKKRQANESFTMEQLHELLDESKKLRFLFKEELRILSKELSDLITWRAKAQEVIDGDTSTSIANVVERLQSFDLLVYGKLQKAKKKLHIGDVVATDAEKEGNESTDMDISLVPSSEAQETIKKEEEESAPTPMEVDAEGSNDSAEAAESTKKESPKPEVVPCNGKVSSIENGQGATVAKLADANGLTTMNVQVLEVHADSIMTHVRIESGCMQKSAAKDEEDDADTDDSKTSWIAKNGRDLLEPLLTMAEESFTAVNSLELKEAEARQTVEELVLAGDDGDITENITDESVRALDGWKQQLVHVQTEGDVLSVEAPEQQALRLIIALLEWLQGSRSLFYDEILPLQDLVAKGDNIAEELEAVKALDVVKPRTFDTLKRMLWPLSYLKTHEKVVLEWTERVHKCVADKHARVNELQTLLDNGSGLLLEQGTFKIVMEEAKKARFWLSKLKKRLRALMTKGVGRMSMSAARSLVEEGEDIAIDMPVFDFLKEHLEIASDWENRVLASGIENGQARVANLLGLLNEYECARLVIDLDMHRDVLKSATERYCICRQPFDGLMIGCDYCDDWFHDSCIGMSKEKAEKVEHYTCPSCSILQELGVMLEHAKMTGRQGSLWDMQEYAKAFEKHQASALRKVKREEKTVERTEMLLFSCNNQMNQLRARIDDIERAKACLAMNPIARGATLGKQQISSRPVVQTTQLSPGKPLPVVPAATSTSTVVSAPAVKVGTSVPVPVATVGANALLLAAAAASSAAASASTSANSIAATIVTSAGVNATVFNRQQYPSILIPPVHAMSSEPKSVPVKEEPATKPVSADVNIANNVKEAKDSTEPPSNTSHTTSSSTATISSTKSVTVNTTVNHQPTTTATKTTVTSSAPFPPKRPTPPLLNPMAATLMGSTERLAALVVAGGVEQQLAKMKSEHVEASKQVVELQSSLRLSRERLANAQQALRELSDVFHARHRMLPFAQTWVQRAASLLNRTTLLSRANIDFSAFLPREYATILDQMEQPASAETTDPSSSTVSPSIDKLFPGVDMFARLLRSVSWSQVVVSLLQERPSRGEISDAIAYATEHGLWGDKKILTPLRSLIGRVDAWVSRAHKCMTKTANKSQQLSRLKLLMNEYSKLPLSFAKTAEPLNTYIKLLAGVGTKSKIKGEDESLSQEAAEAAAIKALDEAMIAISPSSAASGVNATGGVMKKQTPRKRKAYTRKDKAPVARSSKKMKKPHDAASIADKVPSSTQSATTASATSVKGATTNAVQVGVATKQNAST